MTLGNGQEHNRLTLHSSWGKDRKKLAIAYTVALLFWLAHNAIQWGSLVLVRYRGTQYRVSPELLQVLDIGLFIGPLVALTLYGYINWHFREEGPGKKEFGYFFATISIVLGVGSLGRYVVPNDPMQPIFLILNITTLVIWLFWAPYRYLAGLARLDLIGRKALYRIAYLVPLSLVIGYVGLSLRPFPVPATTNVQPLPFYVPEPQAANPASHTHQQQLARARRGRPLSIQPGEYQGSSNVSKRSVEKLGGDADWGGKNYKNFEIRIRLTLRNDSSFKWSYRLSGIRSFRVPSETLFKDSVKGRWSQQGQVLSLKRTDGPAGLLYGQGKYVVANASEKELTLEAHRIPFKLDRRPSQDGGGDSRLSNQTGGLSGSQETGTGTRATQIDWRALDLNRDGKAGWYARNGKGDVWIQPSGDFLGLVLRRARGHSLPATGKGCLGTKADIKAFLKGILADQGKPLFPGRDRVERALAKVEERGAPRNCPPELPTRKAGKPGKMQGATVYRLDLDGDGEVGDYVHTRHGFLQAEGLELMTLMVHTLLEERLVDPGFHCLTAPPVGTNFLAALGQDHPQAKSPTAIRETLKERHRENGCLDKRWNRETANSLILPVIRLQEPYSL